MIYSDFNEHVFKKKVHDALKAVERVLEVHRNPRLADDVEHEYENKYDLANLMTNTAIIAHMNCLEKIGITADVLKRIDTTKATTMRFETSISYSFLKEQTVEVPMESTIQTTTTTKKNKKKSTISQVVNNIKEYHWKIDMDWEISIFAGTNVKDKQIVQNRSSSMVIVKQSSDEKPIFDHYDPVDISLSWLLEQIDKDALTSRFKIDTQHVDTKTPRRNKQVDDTLSFMSDLRLWMHNVASFFNHNVCKGIIDKHNPAVPVKHLSYNNIMHKLSSNGFFDTFMPIQPLMEGTKTTNQDGSNNEKRSNDHTESESTLSLATPKEIKDGEINDVSPLLSIPDMHKLLNEQIRTLQEQSDAIKNSFVSDTKGDEETEPLISASEALLVMLTTHSQSLSDGYTSTMQFIEKMLENQLVAAIGKRVESSDLDQFVRYHNCKLLNPSPQPFCHSICLPNHCPDGILSIESTDEQGKPEPIHTLVRQVDSPSPLKIPLNAASTLELTGKILLHGWVNHRFDESRKSFKLIARARQFSSFILLIGTMTGPNQLDPKDAIILQNKDEVIIPLLLNEIPTATEFKDAIHSLSPEQQRFAKAFRAMQLGSSVLGICVIQIKPQLEELLNLPPDTLTKQMKLTQDLMKLFVEYQVPSDLLSYGNEDDVASPRSAIEKINNVKNNVKSVMDVIDELKSKQLEETAMKADMACELTQSDGVEEEVDYFEEEEVDCYEEEVVECRSECFQHSVHVNEVENSFGGFQSQSIKLRSPSMRPYARCLIGSDSGHERRGGERMPQSRSKGPMPAIAKISSIKFEGNDYQVVDNCVPGQPEAAKKHQNFVKVDEASSTDFTAMPKILDSMIQKCEKGVAIRSTIIKTGNTWIVNRKENLLTKVKPIILRSDEIKSAKDEAFDLLDALCRSGSLPISCSELHVIVSITHCFEKDVMGTVIQDNINPIEKLEMSTLLMASAVHNVPAITMIHDENEKKRLAASFPLLLLNNE